MVKFVIIIGTFLILCNIKLSAQNHRISYTPYAILDLTSEFFICDDSLMTVREAIDAHRWGFRVELIEENSELLVQTNTISFPFEKLLQIIKTKSQITNFTYVPLIIRNEVSEEKISMLVDKLNLGEHIITEELLLQNQIVDWYFQNGKHILILSESLSFEAGKYVIPMANYINENAEESPVFSTYLNVEYTSENNSIPFTSLKLGNESAFVKQIVSDWKLKARFPVYFLVNSFNYSFRSLTRAIENFPKVMGELKSADENKIRTYWKEFPGAMTLNGFCFPVENTEEFTLTPHSAGYSFKPAVLNYNDFVIDKKTEFVPKQIKLSENLKAFYQFNGSLRDETLLNSGIKNYGSEFVEDKEQGEVIEFKLGDFAELPPVQNFNFVNNSFSISVWVNLTSDNEYQAILCNTENSFRKGLQFAIRDGLPYMGFWHIDLKGNTNIELREWYHLTCVYNNEIEQMQIYINGVLDAEANDFLSFDGSKDGTIFLGKNPVGHQFSGKLNDLIIWDRPLADFEVRTLFQKGLESEKFKKYWWHNKTFSSILIVFGILLLVLFLSWALHKFRLIQKLKGPSNEIMKDRRLQIYLFGEFKIVDNLRNDYTNLFTPKIRNVFIVILYNSFFSDKNGIDSLTLSDLLWPDTTHKNALNNRRVAIKRLKSVLEEIDDIKLEKTNQIYQIVIGEKTYIDFVEYKKIIEEHDSARIQELIKLLSRGVFLYKVDRPWADELKNKVTNQIIEDIANLLNINTITTNDKISLADILLLNDPVDEFAIKKKIEFLLSSGHEKSAELAFKKFRKNYFEFFNEEFKEKLI